MLLAVLIVAIFWEIFELFFNVTSLQSINYWQDSSGDILSSFVGGIFAFLYFIKNKKAKCVLMPKIDDNLIMSLNNLK